MKKKNVIVSVGRKLTKKERQSFSKDYPGYRLCFRLRYPNLPFVISIVNSAIAIIIGIIALIIRFTYS